MANKEHSQPLRYATALSIAGLDPSGGAGLLADVKTFSALGVYGMAVATALTVQNTLGVTAVCAVDADVVYKQIVAVMSDIKPDAVKIGMVHDEKTIVAIAKAIEEHQPRHVVIDPVMVSSSGEVLMRGDALETFTSRLLPLATLVTPNQSEQTLLSAHGCDAESLAHRDIAVLETGGDCEGDTKTDILYTVDRTETFSSQAVNTHNTHGTGCTLSSAIAAYLAQGLGLVDAVSQAKQYVTQALASGADVDCGHGHGSMNHFFAPQRLVGKTNYISQG